MVRISQGSTDSPNRGHLTPPLVKASLIIFQPEGKISEGMADCVYPEIPGNKHSAWPTAQGTSRETKEWQLERKAPMGEVCSVWSKPMCCVFEEGGGHLRNEAGELVKSDYRGCGCHTKKGHVSEQFPGQQSRSEDVRLHSNWRQISWDWQWGQREVEWIRHKLRIEAARFGHWWNVVSR